MEKVNLFRNTKVEGIYKIGPRMFVDKENLDKFREGYDYEFFIDLKDAEKYIEGKNGNSKN